MPTLTDEKHIIQMRMEELGVKSYSLQIIKKSVDTTTSNYNAHNEYWFLFDCNNTSDAWTIDSDIIRETNSTFFADGVPFNLSEHTGDISITTAGSTVFSFYRVYNLKFK